MARCSRSVFTQPATLTVSPICPARPAASTLVIVPRSEGFVMIPWGRGREGTRGTTTPSPSHAGCGGLVQPGDGGRPAGHFLPALGSVFTRDTRPPSQLAGSSLRSRGPAYSSPSARYGILVSVSAFRVRLGRAAGARQAIKPGRRMLTGCVRGRLAG